MGIFDTLRTPCYLYDLTMQVGLEPLMWIIYTWALPLMKVLRQDVMVKCHFLKGFWKRLLGIVALEIDVL